MLSRQKALFSGVFYKFHRKRVFVGLIIAAAITIPIWFATGKQLAGVVQGEGEVVPTSILTAFCLWFSFAAGFGVRDLFQVRLLPYFERRMGTIDTFGKGRPLLWNSGRIDAVALSLGLRPLSDFFSGDSGTSEKNLTWFPADDALRTVERLLEPDVAASFTESVLSDLRALGNALRHANSGGTRFCLLMREGDCASGAEMDRRHGSYF